MAEGARDGRRWTPYRTPEDSVPLPQSRCFLTPRVSPLVLEFVFEVSLNVLDGTRKGSGHRSTR